MSSATLLRLASKTADGSVLFPDCVPGRNDMAGYEPPSGIGASDRRSHALKHIVAKHEVVKESRGRMAYDQGCERPCAPTAAVFGAFADGQSCTNSAK